MTTTLDKIKAGEKCLINKVNIPDKVVKKRFLDMGFTKGVVVTIFKTQNEKSGLMILGIYDARYLVRKKDVKFIDVIFLENQKNIDIENTK